MIIFRRVLPVFLIMAFIAAGLLSSGGRALAQQTNQDDGELRRTISVSGSGQVNVRPDVAVARLGVRTDADTAQEALNQNNQSMQALLDALQEAGKENL